MVSLKSSHQFNRMDLVLFYAGLGRNVFAMFPPVERNPRPSLHLRLWLPALLPQVQQHEVECQVYQRAGRLAGSLVGPIRLLHAMKDPAQSERLTRMMDHVEGMRKETGRLLRSMSSSRSSVWESPSQRSRLSAVLDSFEPTGSNCEAPESLKVKTPLTTTTWERSVLFSQRWPACHTHVFLTRGYSTALVTTCCSGPADQLLLVKS